VFACAVGAGLIVVIGLACRVSRSARGIGCVKGSAPNSGLRGRPGQVPAWALVTNGLRPCFRARPPDGREQPPPEEVAAADFAVREGLNDLLAVARAFSASSMRRFDAVTVEEHRDFRYD
jgi:hypothetical protein